MERILRLLERWKETEAPVTLKGVLGTASPSVGPSDALGVGRPQINLPSGLNRCDKVILAILLHAGFFVLFFYSRLNYLRAVREVGALHDTKFLAPIGAGEDVKQVTFEVPFCFYLYDDFAAVY